MARLSTTSNQTEETEIRATLLSDSFGAEDFSAQPITATNSLNSLDSLNFSHESERADSSFSRPNSSELVKHCHVCDAETFLGDKFCQECGSIQPAFEEATGSYSPQRVKQMIASNSKSLLAIVAASVLFFSLLVGIVSVLRASDDLEKALATNRLNDAVQLSERLKVLHFGVLVGRDAELYSDAFLKRAQVFLTNGNFRLALFDLSKVLPNYKRIAEVSQLKTICQGQLAGGALSGVGSVSADGVAPRQATAPVVIATPASRINSSNRTVGAPGINSSVSSSARNSTGAVSTAASSNPSLRDVPAETQAATNESTNSDVEEVNSEEVDMAAYNRRLAEYFSKKNTRNALAKDPPSFSEWVQSGKTEF